MNCSRNSVFDLTHLFCCLLRQCPESIPMPPSLSQSLGAWRKSGINLGVSYHDLGVVTMG